MVKDRIMSTAGRRTLDEMEGVDDRESMKRDIALEVNSLIRSGKLSTSPVIEAVAAVSVGVVGGVPMLDLEYVEDVACDTDMNVVMTGAGRFIEVQGTAEGAPFSRAELDQLLALAEKGILELQALQAQALAE